MISGRIALALLLGAALAGPASTEEGKIMGVMFGDYYWVASADSADSGAVAPQKSHTNPKGVRSQPDTASGERTARLD